MFDTIGALGIYMCIYLYIQTTSVALAVMAGLFQTWVAGSGQYLCAKTGLMISSMSPVVPNLFLPTSYHQDQFWQPLLRCLI